MTTHNSFGPDKDRSTGAYKYLFFFLYKSNIFIQLNQNLMYYIYKKGIYHFAVH